jgi:hypothetical protein
MELSFKKNIVFPGGGDFVLPLLMPVDNPRAADGLPGLESPPHRGAGGQRSAPASPQKRVGVARGAAGGGGQQSGAAPEGRAEPAPLEAGAQVADRKGGDGNGAARGSAAPAAQHAAAAKPFVQLQLRRRSPGGADGSAPEAAAAAVLPA